MRKAALHRSLGELEKIMFRKQRAQQRTASRGWVRFKEWQGGKCLSPRVPNRRPIKAIQHVLAQGRRTGPDALKILPEAGAEARKNLAEHCQRMQERGFHLSRDGLDLFGIAWYLSARFLDYGRTFLLQIGQPFAIIVRGLQWRTQ